jgi:hypothetical protein
LKALATGKHRSAMKEAAFRLLPKVPGQWRYKNASALRKAEAIFAMRPNLATTRRLD